MANRCYRGKRPSRVRPGVDMGSTNTAAAANDRGVGLGPGAGAASLLLA